MRSINTVNPLPCAALIQKFSGKPELAEILRVILHLVVIDLIDDEKNLLSDFSQSLREFLHPQESSPAVHPLQKE